MTIYECLFKGYKEYPTEEQLLDKRDQLLASFKSGTKKYAVVSVILDNLLITGDMHTVADLSGIDYKLIQEYKIYICIKLCREYNKLTKQYL